ncbi:hypothetical protein E2C01_047774 [Portunus trituberculatus]|uniref:Uncharacterized protein n=1 Tax=Portunus trituberculatus TaxID=210409 RepID=A0A5B7G1Y6_PORTR|nr:hypothetical protein [Portunus trituberculatus]
MWHGVLAPAEPIQRVPAPTPLSGKPKAPQSMAPSSWHCPPRSLSADTLPNTEIQLLVTKYFPPLINTPLQTPPPCPPIPLTIPCPCPTPQVPPQHHRLKEVLQDALPQLSWWCQARLSIAALSLGTRLATVSAT